MPKKKISPVIHKKSNGVNKTKILKNQITKLLDTAKIKYKTLEHKVVFTAHDVSATTKKKLGEIAKVVLVKVTGAQPVIASPEALRGAWQPQNKKIASDAFAMTKGTYFVLIVLPAGKYVDFNGIKKALKAKKVSMASEKDITKYLKTKVGLLHPFGSEYNLKTLLDKNLSRAKKMIASAGTYTHSIELSLKDFEKLTQPLKGVFSKSKK